MAGLFIRSSYGRCTVSPFEISDDFAPGQKLTLSLCMFAALLARAQSDPGMPADAGAGDPPHAANRPPRADDVSASGRPALADLRAGEHHLPGASGISFAVLRAELHAGARRVQDVAGGDDLHRSAAARNLRYNTDAIFDLESSGGRGISEALGLAGFTNLDVVRNPQLGPMPYVARAQIHQTIGLTSKMVDAQRTQFSLATEVPDTAARAARGQDEPAGCV